MKKIITAALIIALGINSNAQGNEKDFRFARPLGRTQRRQVRRSDHAKSPVFDAFLFRRPSYRFPRY